jgi:AAA lid domain
MCKNRDKNFGNGRAMRNIFEKTLEIQANRLALIPSITDNMLETILPEDLPKVAI